MWRKKIRGGEKSKGFGLCNLPSQSSGDSQSSRKEGYCSPAGIDDFGMKLSPPLQCRHEIRDQREGVEEREGRGGAAAVTVTNVLEHWSRLISFSDQAVLRSQVRAY